MHAGATGQLLYGCAYVREIIHPLELVDYLPVHTHKPYNNYTYTEKCTWMMVTCIALGLRWCHYIRRALYSLPNISVREKGSNALLIVVVSVYSKTCVKRPLKIDKTKILMTNGSLMKVERVAECSPWSILQYF